ncbi:MAG: glucose 1-dehydrogenase [Verrucomicrobiota bacterium]
MKAVAVSPRQKFSARLLEIPAPKPGRREVLVQTLEIGIDGTDAEINEGLYGSAPANADFLIVGHEALGRVLAVGDEVADLQPGDLVVPMVRRPCPEACANCRRDHFDMCSTGHYLERGIKGLHGFLSDLFVEEPRFLVKVPESIQTIATLLEPLSVVEKAVLQAFTIQHRLTWTPKTALVLGAGPIGLFATMILQLHGLKTFTVDRVPEESAKARIVSSTGATYIKNESPSLNETAENITRAVGDPIDFIVEATGYSPFVFQSMSLIGLNGVVALLGISGGDLHVRVPADCLNLDMVLGNKLVFGSVNSNLDHFEQGLQHMHEFEQRWPGLFSQVVTRRLPLDEFSRSFEKEPGGIKTVLQLNR